MVFIIYCNFFNSTSILMFNQVYGSMDDSKFGRDYENVNGILCQAVK